MHNDDIDFANALPLQEAGELIGITTRRCMLLYIQQGLLHSRYASQKERKLLRGKTFHSRLLLVDKNEVIAMSERIPEGK